MLILLALPVLVAVAAMHRNLQRYAPSNVLVRSVRRSLPTWRMAAALLVLAVALAGLANVLTRAIGEGAPGWLNLAVLVFAWDSIKIGLLGSVVVARRALSTVCQARYRGDPRDPAAAIDPASRRTETLASLCPEQT